MGFKLGNILKNPLAVAGSLLNPVGMIGTVASMGSDIYAADQARQATTKQNEMQERVAEEQMAFQERMSSTAHQREVEDLRKAGLNPILSAGGSGESTPSGAMPNIARVPSMGEQVVSSAKQNLNMFADIASTYAQAKSSIASAEYQDVQTEKLKTTVPQAEISGSFYKWLGGFLRQMTKNAAHDYRKLNTGVSDEEFTPWELK